MFNAAHHDAPLPAVTRRGKPSRVPGGITLSEASRHNFAPEGSGSAGLSRRQVVKAGAWSAPVVAVAIAAPGAAATGGPPTVTPTGPPSVSGTGVGRTVIFTTTGSNVPKLSGALDWTHVSQNGNTTTTGTSTAAITSTTVSGVTTYSFTFVVTFPAASGTATGVIKISNDNTLIYTGSQFTIL